MGKRAGKGSTVGNEHVDVQGIAHESRPLESAGVKHLFELGHTASRDARYVADRVLFQRER